jgi:hypothetical protein
MKIYIPIKLELIRLTVKGNCQPTEYINLIDTTHELTIQFIIKQFSGYMFKCSKFKTTIDVRHCIGGENGKSQRVSLFGIKPKEAVEILTKKLT